MLLFLVTQVFYASAYIAVVLPDGWTEKNSLAALGMAFEPWKSKVKDINTTERYDKKKQIIYLKCGSRNRQ